MVRYTFVIFTGVDDVRGAWCEALPDLAAVRSRAREALFCDCMGGEWGPGENTWTCRVDCAGNQPIYMASVLVPQRVTGGW